MLNNSTAPADKSLIILIFGFGLGSTKLHRCSIAVLKASAANTKPIAKSRVIHSFPEIFNQNPKPITASAITLWIIAFLSNRNK